MAIAAVPRYLGQDFNDASPGMRFSFYLRIWGEDQGAHRGAKGHDFPVNWGTADSFIKQSGQQKQDRPVTEDNKASALALTCPLNASDKATLQGLQLRTEHAFSASCDDGKADGLTLDAISSAPFCTGLGLEHPIENGFSFLAPYGLPYLSGSSIKGVVRQAARELMSNEWGDHAACDAAAFAALFGNEAGASAHFQRGALSFWDVIPDIKDHMVVEIMTPHQSHYYQVDPHMDSNSPHESGKPNPIPFLAVPAGTPFCFRVICDTSLLQHSHPDLLQDQRWKGLLQQAFAHAFQWMGFGAKTSVGYGAMREDPRATADRQERDAKRQQAAEALARERALAAMDPTQREIQMQMEVVEVFSVAFESARRGNYRPGQDFDSKRSDFIKTALGWSHESSRRAAGALLRLTSTKAWGKPSNKDSLKRLNDAVAELDPQNPA